MIQFNLLQSEKFKLVQRQIVKILALLLMILAPLLFLYFLVQANFIFHYAIAAGCFMMLFVGFFLWFWLHAIATEKSTELLYEKVRQQVKRLNWLALALFWCGGVLFFAGILILGMKNLPWSNSLVFFTGSIIAVLIGLHGLIRKQMTKQHYELNKQNQEILERLDSLRRKEKAPLPDTLLA